MSSRKLPINFESLWQNPNNKFIVRYKNIDEKHQKIFAQRIKETTGIKTLKRLTGPTIEDIHNLLLEINPIIFGERQDSTNNQYAFAKYRTNTINGYTYKILCQGIYRILCRRKPITNNETQALAYTTSPDYTTRLNLFTPTQETIRSLNRPLPHEEIDLQIINNATRRVGTPTVPREMEQEITEEEMDQTIQNLVTN